MEITLWRSTPWWYPEDIQTEYSPQLCCALHLAPSFSGTRSFQSANTSEFSLTTCSEVGKFTPILQMAKLRQNSEVTCIRSRNLSVTKPGICLQKSRPQISVRFKFLPTTTKQAIHATFIPPLAAVVLLTQRKIFLTEFPLSLAKSTWSCQSAVYYALRRGISSEAR